MLKKAIMFTQKAMYYLYFEFFISDLASQLGQDLKKKPYKGDFFIILVVLFGSILLNNCFHILFQVLLLWSERREQSSNS